ncbi:MAG: tRNA lysidine(34) synthetase TilS [Legionellales bacterium]|nr:tRNA lysidine(34) synthetase TilS [Legionellales bacterium]|tara:strand:+ start:10392 stop:11705 length:1314 start_codon:yes stop_codon:yes gene_type:complete
MANELEQTFPLLALLRGIAAPVKRLLIAYSGGLDSHVLLALIASQPALRQQYQIEAIHINHGLSEHANRWSEHCQQVCDGFDIPLISKTITINGDNNLEAKARAARYQAMSEAMTQETVLLTAHHQNDQAETVLLQLLRGAGPKGLASMADLDRFAAGYRCRPLLSYPRVALEAHANAQQLQWVDDESNVDTRFDRNFLRHHIMPQLQQQWPAAIKSLARSAKHCADLDSLVEDVIDRELDAAINAETGGLMIAALQTQSRERQHAMLRHWLYQHDAPLPSTKRLEQIVADVINARDDASPSFCWGNVGLKRFKGELQLTHNDESDFDSSQVLTWDLASRLNIPGVGELQVASGDGLRAPNGETVTVRFRLGGERFHPLGRQGSHPLKKLFQEWGIPPWQRQLIPLIYYNETLVAVVGYGYHQQYFQAVSGITISVQ